MGRPRFPGITPTAPISSTPGVSPGATCLPQLTVTKATSTPTVVQTMAGTAATYTITVANAAAVGDAINTSISDTLPAGFTYAATSSVTLSGGATGPSVTNPVAGAAVPSWSSFTIPGGGQVQITFTVNIAAGVALGTYQNPARATYSDPTRSVPGGTVSSQYTPGVGTPDNVTLVAPDMTIVKSHAGTFVRGSPASYSIVATNSGSAATSGTVTVTDTLPAGLTPTAVSGPGWTCPAPAGQNISCTRNDALAAGASYPAITVTVNVLEAAANSVINTATVAGGGELNGGNDSSSDPTSVTSSADVSLVKSHAGNFNVGQNGVYALAIHNAGPSTAAGPITVSDTLPAGLTFVSGTGPGWTCTAAGQVVTCTNPAAMVSAANSSITLTVAVGPGAAPVVTNTASVSSSTPDPTPGNNNSSDPTTVVPQADLSIVKSHAGNFTVGQNATYTLAVNNAGPSTAAGPITVTDTLPAGLSFVSGTGAGWTCSAAGQVVTCTNPAAMVSAANSSITLTVAVGPGAAPAVANTATVSSSTGDPNLANNTSTDPTTVVPQADLSIVKSHVGNFTVGQNGVYTLAVSNAGPSVAAATLTVSDTLPGGLTFVSGTGPGWTCSAAGQVVTCTNPANLAAGGNTSITLVVGVGPAAPPGVTNTATVNSPTADPNPANNTSSDPTTVNPVDDLSIVKSHAGNFTVGQNGTYTLTVANAGPSPSGALTVIDTLPGGLGFVSGTGPGWTCSAVAQTVTCTNPGLASGGNSSITLVVSVGPAAAPSVINTASVSSPVFDSNLNNNSSSDPTTVTPQADLSIVKSHAGNFTVGVNGTYTLAVHNGGPSPAAGPLTVTDTLPAGLSFVSGTGPGWGCAAAGQVVTCTNPANLAAGGNSSISLVVGVGPAAAPGVANTAAVSGPTPDPTPGNNSSSDPTTVMTSADVSIVKSHAGSFGVGANGTYTLAVSNGGPSPAAGTITVSDNLPIGLTFVSATGPGWTCSAAGQLVTCNNPATMASGGSSTITLVVAVGGAAPGVTNTATVSSPTPDPNLVNNTSSDPTSVAPLADLAITKTVDNPTPNVGQDVTFTVTATDNGPNDATGVTVGDVLPTGLTLVSSNPAPGTTYIGGVWTIGTLANGTSEQLVIVAMVTQAGSITNTASVSHENEADPTPADDTANATVVGQSADLSIVKSHAGNFTVGQNGTYTLAVHNAGPSTAVAPITVTDTLPTGLSLVSGTGTGWTCSAVAQVVTCTNAASLASGADTSITLVVGVGPAAAPSVVNSASVSSPTPDGNLPNNSSADPTTVIPQADLVLVKSHVGNFTVGTNGTYTLTLHNAGPSPAAGPQTITDALPAGLTFISGSGSGWVCSAAGQAVTCTHAAALASGGSTAVSLLVAVGAQAAPAVTNTASASSPTPDPNPGNNTSGDPTTVAPLADLALTKVVDNASPNVGQNVTFTVTAHNNGPNDATGVTLSDSLPPGLTPVSVTPAPGTSYSGGVWTIGSLANGASTTLVMMATAAQPGTLTNTATVTHEDQVDSTPADDTASASVNAMPSADIQVSKSVDNNAPHVGDNVTFTVTAHNNGPDDATGVHVIDLLPTGLTLVSSSPSQGTYTAGVWDVGSVANGVSAALQVVAHVAQAGSITNTATKSAETEFDPNTANDTDSSTVNAQAAADIQVQKMVDNPNPSVSQDVTFTVTAHNNGPSSATGVHIADPLPAGLTLVSSIASQGALVAGDWNVGGLANGATATLKIRATVTATGLITNTATKSAEVEFDPNSANNAASASITGQPSADIQVLKVVDNATPSVGQNVVFTVTAHNNGPQGATGVHVTDNLPAGLALVSSAVSQGTYAGGDWAVGSLPNGAGATLTITAKVLQTGPITNTASKALEDQFDANPNNNSAQASLNGSPSADIAISKVVNKTSAHVGENMAFTVTAHNNGPNDASGVTVTDILPAGLALVSAAPAPGTTYSGGIWTIGSIPSGAGRTLQVTATVMVTGVITNTATKTAENEFDPNASNNAASASVTGLPTADIQVLKTVDNPNPNLGQTVTFTVTARNNGPQTATGVHMSDALPAGLSLVSTTPGQGMYDVVTGDWNVGTIANGAAPTLLVAATVTRTGATTNTASKTAEVEFDGTPGDDSASATVTAPPVADVGVLKTVSNAAPNVGENVTFTITATDHGPDGATGVHLTDILPPGLTLVSATPTQGAFDAASGVWNMGSIGNGGSATLQVVATVTQAGSLTNTATKTAEDQADNNQANDSASVTLVAATSADLGLTKTHVGDFTAGQTGVFTLTVTNHGPSPSAAATVVDTLPAGLTFVSSSNPGVWTCTAVGQVVTCVAGSGLASGASSSFDITVNVDQSAAARVTNTATVRGATPDSNPANNVASDAVNVVVVDLALQKALSGALTAGGTATYTLAVTNVGTGTTFGLVTVVDTLPAGLTLVSAGGSGWTCSASGRVVTCTNPAPIAPGGVSTLTVVVSVEPGATGTLTNLGRVTTAGDLNRANDSASSAASVGQAPPPLIPAMPHAGMPPTPAAGLPGWAVQLVLGLVMAIVGGWFIAAARRRAVSP